jgi:hypothetical protein
LILAVSGKDTLELNSMEGTQVMGSNGKATNSLQNPLATTVRGMLSFHKQVFAKGEKA